MTKPSGPADCYRPYPRRSISPPPPSRNRQSTIPHSAPPTARRSQPDMNQFPPEKPLSYHSSQLHGDLALNVSRVPTEPAQFSRECNERLAFAERGRDRPPRHRRGGNQRDDLMRTTWQRDGGYDRFISRSRSRSPLDWDRTSENRRSNWRSMTVHERERADRFTYEREERDRVAERSNIDHRECGRKRDAEEENKARVTKERERAKRGRIETPPLVSETIKSKQQPTPGEEDREKLVGPVLKKPTGKLSSVHVAGAKTQFPIDLATHRNPTPRGEYLPIQQLSMFKSLHDEIEKQREVKNPASTADAVPLNAVSATLKATIGDSAAELDIPSPPEIFSTYLSNASNTFSTVYNDLCSQIEHERERNRSLTTRVEKQNSTLLELRIQIERMQHDWQREKMEWDALQAQWGGGIGDMDGGGIYYRGMMMGMGGLMSGFGPYPMQAYGSSLGMGANHYPAIPASITASNLVDGSYAQGEGQQWVAGTGAQPMFRNWQLRINHDEVGEKRAETNTNTTSSTSKNIENRLRISIGESIDIPARDMEVPICVTGVKKEDINE